MDDLVTFLHQQFDDEERVARAATRGPWRVANVAEYGSATVDGPDAMQDGGADGNGGRLQVLRPLTVIPKDVDYGPTVDLADAEHIARHDPACVLAEVDAKRRILDRCAEVIGDRDLSGYDGFGSLADEPTALALFLAVETMRDLTLPYADRDGYRDEWKP